MNSSRLQKKIIKPQKKKRKKERKKIKNLKHQENKVKR